MRKRVIWLEYMDEWTVMGHPEKEIYSALKMLMVKYPGIDIEIHKRLIGIPACRYAYYVRLELPKELAEISDESILDGMDVRYSDIDDNELFIYLRNTLKNIEYDEQRTKKIKEYRPKKGRKETS